MVFKKVNPSEEIRKAVEKDSELLIYVKEEHANYELIKSIVEYRKSVGITQSQVAEKSGLTQQMVSRIEKLDNSPTLDNFLRYVLAIGLELKVEKAANNIANDEQAACVIY